MNPMLRAMSLFGRGGLQGGLNGFASGSPDIYSTPEIVERQTRYDAARSADAMPKSNPMDRIKDAFTALKDMHKGGEPALDASQMPWLSSLTFPMKAPASQGFPQSPMNAQAQAPSPVPMPMPRPAEAPQGDPMMSAFQRNAALQKDPNTGEFLDPEAAQGADPGIFKALALFA